MKANNGLKITTTLVSRPIVRLWAVLGADSSGKSTTVGHLVGDFGRGGNGVSPNRGEEFKEVLLRGGGYLYLYSRRQSVQEAKKTAEEIVDIVSKASAKQASIRPTMSPMYSNVLLSLRTDTKTGLPVAAHYLDHFIRRGWLIRSLALLSPRDAGRELYRSYGAPICYVRGAGRISVGSLRGQARISYMVGQVRNHFGWA